MATVLATSGEPLDLATRRMMEARFGHDFGPVRLHSGARAADSAARLRAQAYTWGNHIVLGAARQRRDTPEHQHTLAHELAHVVQQSRARAPLHASPPAMLEAAAESAAKAFRTGVAPIAVAGVSGRQIACQPISASVAPAPAVEPRSRRGSLQAQSLSDYALQEELELLDAWLAEHPDDFLLQQEFDRLMAVARRRNARAEKQERRQRQIAAVVEAVEAGRVPKWMKVFPFRPSRGIFRMDVAPIMAHRDGDSIVVEQPLNGVKYTDRFRQDVKTLPDAVFLGGLKLSPRELVGVRLYDDDEKVVVIFAEDLLKFAKASNNAVWLNIGLTAASVVAGPAVGRIGGRVLGSLVSTGQRVAQRGLFAATLGTAEAAPTALAGATSRASIMLVENRGVATVAQQVVGQSSVRAGVQTAVTQSTSQAAVSVAPSLATTVAPTVGVVATDIAGATTVNVSPADYAARLSFVHPEQFDDAILNAVERAGQQAASVLSNPNTPAGARFIQACRNRNWTLAGTLFHGEAARQLQALAPGVTGAQITAEDVVQAGKGGSRLDVTAIDGRGVRYNIDWKTTGRSAFGSKARSELQRHARHYLANRGAALDVQVSKSWVDFVRGLIPNVNWPK